MSKSSVPVLGRDFYSLNLPLLSRKRALWEPAFPGTSSGAQKILEGDPGRTWPRCSLFNSGPDQLPELTLLMRCWGLLFWGGGEMKEERCPSSQRDQVKCRASHGCFHLPVPHLPPVLRASFLPASCALRWAVSTLDVLEEILP